jgi:hypothetical protein
MAGAEARVKRASALTVIMKESGMWYWSCRIAASFLEYRPP